jgi:hypothetical protein
MKPGATTDRPSSRRRRLADATLLAGFLSLVAVTYAFVVSAGHFTAWPQWTDYYDTQAEGFRAGHLYTTVPPTPGLERLDDPLNPANARFWRWDYSYFGGHLYLYWGLAPAVLLAAVKALLHARGVVGDEVLVFAFLVGRALVGCLLIRAMARRLPVPPPAWAVWAAMAAFALAHPTPYLLARAAIYEAAIAGGALFLLGGLALAFQGIFASTRRAADGWLLGASLSLGLAGASRVSLFPAALAIVGCAIWARWRSDGGGFQRFARIALAASAPAGAVALAHLAANQLRFGSWTEFGTSHHMTMPGFKIGLRFLVANLQSRSRPISFAFRQRAPC